MSPIVRQRRFINAARATKSPVFFYLAALAPSLILMQSVRAIIQVCFTATLVWICGASITTASTNNFEPNSNFPLPGEWPSFRRTGSLDARSPLKGTIFEPHIAWKQFIGKTDTLLEIKPGKGTHKLSVPIQEATNDLARANDPRWKLPRPAGLIEGRLQPVEHSATTTYARIFSHGENLEKIDFESGFAKPTINGQWQNEVGRCFTWTNGAWSKVWESEEIKLLFQPLPLVDDFDGDGKLEAAILPWHELIVVDAVTGRVKDRCSFTAGRSYGFFGAYDLAGDGRKEFVVQADFAKHVDVLGYRNGRLGVLWQREIELDISNPQKILNVVADPVADVDGDGKLEVLVNTYNASGDHRWHLTVHDGMTGALKAELLDECLKSVVDLSGNGTCELLTIKAEHGWVPSTGTIRVYSAKGGVFRSLWQRENAAWETWDSPQPSNINSATTRGNADVLYRRVNEGMCVVISGQDGSKPNQMSLSRGVWQERGFTFGPVVIGPELKAIGLDPEGNLLVRASTAGAKPETVTVKSGEARVLASQHRGVEPMPAAVVLDKSQSKPTIIVQGAGELVGFHAPNNKTDTELVRFPQSGQTRGKNRAPSAAHARTAPGPVAADLFGDGHRQLIYATDSPEECSRIVACDSEGREVWHHDFTNIPGGPVIWNVGTTVLWQVGHFTGRRGQDVLVTNRRSMMHSEETVLLSGKDGSELWRRDREISGRGVGGTPFAIADYDGDGLEDLASFYPSIFYMLKGNSGKDIKAMDATWEAVPAKPVYWGKPIAGYFERYDQPGLFFAGRSMTGLVRLDGSLAWWDALDKSPDSFPAFGDFAGDGHICALGIGYEDGIRCYDSGTGKIKWRMPAPERGTPQGTASADLNSDGRDEALVVIGQTLYCLAEKFDGKGALLWKISLPSSASPPSIADVDNTGKASILVVGADGYVYCIR